MDFISLANINAINLASNGLLNSPLVEHLLTHELMHAFFNMAYHGAKRKRLTRAQRRKLANRRRRWFVDNIIMHHKRLHDRNREIVVTSAKTKSLARKLHGNAPSSENRKWQDRVEIRDRGRVIRGRVDARRLRARSRWLSAGI